MFEKCISDSQVSFRIFKIYWVYFMWHCRRTDFSLFCFLFEIIHRHIGPYIPAKVNQDIVNAFDAVKMCREIIIMLHLGSVLLTRQPKLINKIVGELYPVRFWKGHKMCIEVAGSAAKFCTKGNAYELFNLVLDPLGKDHYFFSQRGR